MTEDEEAEEIVRRLSKTKQELMFEDLYKSIRELSVMFKPEYCVKKQQSMQKEDVNKENNRT